MCSVDRFLSGCTVEQNCSIAVPEENCFFLQNGRSDMVKSMQEMDKGTHNLLL